MITPTRAAIKVKRISSYEEVMMVKSYDLLHYIVEALPQKGKLPNTGTPTTFCVNKLTGIVTTFHPRPFGTLEKYQNARVCKFNSALVNNT
jgi:hypothetical protein